MKYTVSIEIDLPRERVMAILSNHDTEKLWQPELLRREPLEGTPGEEGARARLVHRMGRQEITMEETVVLRQPPERLSLTYEAKGVWNRVDNHFRKIDDNRTLWKVESEFKCSGFMGLILRLFPGNFRKQTALYQRQFREFAEKNGNPRG